MTEANVIFNFEGRELKIQCSKNEKMKDICQKYANKINKNINSLIFLYGGNQLNFNLTFNKQANIIDKKRNVIKVLVYKNESGECVYPKCGEKIKLDTEKIDDVILSINNIKDTINGIKFSIDNVIKISSDNFVNIQLKNVNIVLNTLNNDIKKINEKLNSLLNNNEIKNINHYIIAEINIKEDDINKEIRILNSYEESLRINKDINKNLHLNNEDGIKKCEIRINEKSIPFNYIHKFESVGKYTIKYSFKNNINNTAYMFYLCKPLTYIDLSNFNTNKVNDMICMFDGCSSLTDINLSNINTSNVTNMECMFANCNSLTNIDLSSFNTKNVNNMHAMFCFCSSLTKINLSNFNTNNVTCCSSLTNINLSNFNTNNVTDMECMFSRCSSLKTINLSNFNTNKVTNMSWMFKECSSLTNIDLSNFNINNNTYIGLMFRDCKNLKKDNIIIKDKNSFNIILKYGDLI